MDEAQEYYEHFSLVVGQRDWLRPNLRHARLRRLVDEEIDGSGLRVLDVGCGAGVMTSHMTRYGEVVGTDFSSSAIELARKLVPGASFNAGRELPGGEFDVITIFDVLEHIPQFERPAFIGGLARRLAPQGRLFVSTPYPRSRATVGSRATTPSRSSTRRSSSPTSWRKRRRRACG